MGGLKGGDAPQGHAHAAVAKKAHPAGAPRLLGAPFHKVIAVPGVVLAEHAALALAVTAAALVHVGNRVAVAAPETGIGRFKFAHLGDRSRRNTHQFPLPGALALPLTEHAPGDDHGHGDVVLIIPGGKIQVEVDGHAVPHLHGHVPVAGNARLRLIGSGVQLGAVSVLPDVLPPGLGFFHLLQG